MSEAVHILRDLNYNDTMENTHSTKQRRVYRVRPGSATSLRKLRKRVRHTVNILALDGMRVDEMPGECWCAEMEERRIRWTPTFPLPPHAPLDDESILYLCAHEQSHVNWSGLISWDGLAKAHPSARNLDDRTKGRFHRFVNAVEDIRVDRLSKREYPGFWPAKLHIDGMVRDWHLASGEPEGWSLVDACGLNWIYSCDLGLPPFGSDVAKAVIKETWPFIDRVANVASTQEVAVAIWPLFAKLAAIDNSTPIQPGAGESQPGQGGGGSGQGTPQPSDPGAAEASKDPKAAAAAAAEATDEKAGADEPTEEPAKSHGDEGTEPLAKGEELKGMAEDAKTQDARDALEDASQSVRADRRDARQSQAMQAGSGAGNSPSMAQGIDGEAQWNRTADKVRGSSNALANRLKAVLRTNAADSYGGSHRRGRLHSSKAYRASAGNPRIFRKREEMGALDYAFAVTVDCSGSMREAGARKQRGAFNASVLVAEAIEKAGLDLMFITWQSQPLSLKRFRDKLSATKADLGRDIAWSRGGTYEAPALIAAIEEFQRNASRHRMLFTITDGETHDPQESQVLIQELHDMGVTCVAIGIGFQPASHYDVHLRVEDPAELAHLLPRFINSFVKKGARR